MKRKMIIMGVILSTSLMVVYGMNADADAQGKAAKGAAGKGEFKGKFKGAHFKGKGGGFLAGIVHHVNDLNLSVNQKSKIQKLRQDVKEDLKPLVEKMRTLKKELINELKKKNYSRTTVAAKYKEIKKLRSEMEDLHFNLALDIYDTLTDSQKKEIWKKIEEEKPFKGKKKGQ